VRWGIWTMDARPPEALRLRPHHLLCLPHFAGKGYSGSFTKNMTYTAALLQREPETPVTLCTEADSLCACCPNRRGKACESEKPARYDRAVLQVCGLQAGQTLPWCALQKKAAPLLHGELEKICGDCQWHSLCAAIEKEYKK
jgi:hypothetical protein